jgi:hypothetical protein
MKKTFIIPLVLALALTVAPAAASAPEDVTIVSEMSVSAAAGTFEASGPAVDAGVICPAGDVYDLSSRAAGYQSNNHLNLFVHKLFVCSDESGAFEMDLNVRIVFSPQETTAKWRVVAADGAYAGLHGNGKLTAVPVTEDILIDTYTGGLHIE